jgi:hypothetical protein
MGKVQQHQQIRRPKKQKGKGQEETGTTTAMSYHNNGQIRGASQFNSY